jgi:tetratricopeptide (TPR) repeat protein
VGVGGTLNDLRRYGGGGIAACEEALELDPDLAMAWTYKGGALISLRRYDEGLAACERALALDANNPNAWNNKGAALYYLKCYEEAVQAYARTGAGGDSPSLEGRANPLRALGRTAEAQDAERRAKELGG